MAAQESGDDRIFAGWRGEARPRRRVDVGYRSQALDPDRVSGGPREVGAQLALRQHPGPGVEPAEDLALRDRAMEQDLLSGRGDRNDDLGTALRLLPAQGGGSRHSRLRGYDHRPRLLPAEPAVLVPRRDQRLATTVLRGVSG